MSTVSFAMYPPLFFTTRPNDGRVVVIAVLHAVLPPLRRGTLKTKYSRLIIVLEMQVAIG